MVRFMQTQKEAYLYEKLEHDNVRCKTCNRECVISPGTTGFCKTRENKGGILYSLEYGLISSLSINPAEKKPFYHFYPGSVFLTVGSWSCIFTCPWCQNYDISKTPPGNKESRSKILSPYELVTIAKKNNCKGTSMSFSEPATFLEYAVDVFELAKREGLYNTVVTNGYFSSEAIDLLLEKGAHAFNVDIKGDTETYKQYCNADIEKVWQNVRTIKEKGAHIELTTLVIPGINDNESCLNEIAERIKKEVGPETPWHISRYFPAYKFDRPPTPLSSLEKAYLIGKERELLYIYVGNVLGHKYENTYCPDCGEELVSRTGFTIHKNKLGEDKRCPRCGKEIPFIVS